MISMSGNTQYSNEVRANYNYESNLFRQIERINTADTLERKIENIETLEALLQPYKDKQYEDTIKSLRDNMKEEMQKIKDRYGSIKKGDFMKKKYKQAWVKYKALMNLAFRKSFLPEYGIKKKKV